MSGGLVLVLFLLLIMIGIPVAASLGVAAFSYILTMGYEPVLVIQQMINSMDKFTLLAIPFFIMAGGLMEQGGISKRIINFAKTLVGHLPGGLAIVTIVGSFLFATMCGAGAATVAAIGGIMLPAMYKEQYDPDFSCALQTTAGIFGPLIPPSILMVVYGAGTDTSVGDLFMAGVVPGILFLAILIAITVWICMRKGYKGTGHFSIKASLSAFSSAIWAILAPVIILGGIYSGLFTPTEAAAIATLYSLLVGLFIYRELTPKSAVLALFKGIKMAAGILMIVAATQAFGWVLTREQLPQKLAASFKMITQSPTIFLLLVCALLLAAGFFLDAVPACAIFAPILVPTAVDFGISPVHFGIVMIAALCIGLVTPPAGMNLVVASAVGNRPIHKIIPKTIPYLIVTTIGLLIVALIPELSTWLPGIVNP